ncbi:PQQ-binding-like beta-propeller repeat protein [Pseudodonghicola flavimaris]|uniref:PQQ-binding-like beta-propeller repeat protein n=1 Tax=Pseudodonghicola flavimaris TaxID=3050036 RepID=A0ABT7F7D8_9RHOB|nr:PQQ-binding-like beta-propeller repeat protein [Pseudodonghicola flavimaris]MDK3020514.1 PQQ-binding-like beta-propeller repeat protein [Pseudodonghicola flavimaris]
MTAAFSLSRTGLALVGGTVLLLSACAEQEVILPGEREPIYAEETLAAETPANESRVIRLPSQTSNSAWTQGQGTPSYRVSNPALSSAPSLLWTAPIGEGDALRQRITAQPVIANGLIYTLDSSARVTAVTTGGAVAWSTDLVPATDSDGQATGGGLAYHEGTLYVSSGYGRLTALDAATGKQRWQQRLDATGSGQPTVYGGLVYLVAGDDTGWAVDTKDGRIVWQVSATPSITNVLGAPAPAVNQELAIFAFGSGDLMATFRRGGLRRWYASVAGKRKGRARTMIMDVTGSPVIDGGRVYAGNQSGRTVAYDIDTGDRLWTAREGALGPVVPAGGSVFLISDQNKLVRLDSRDGTIIWTNDLNDYVRDTSRKRGAVYANYGPILAGNRIVVASSDGYVHFFDPKSGGWLSSLEVPGGATTAPSVAGGTLYVVSRAGLLYAFR